MLVLFLGSITIEIGGLETGTRFHQDGLVFESQSLVGREWRSMVRLLKSSSRLPEFKFCIPDQFKDPQANTLPQALFFLCKMEIRSCPASDPLKDVKRGAVDSHAAPSTGEILVPGNFSSP